MIRVFFAEYIKHVRTVGAIAPSSRFLARKMLRDVDFDKARTIVEYGPGTGSFTAELIARMQPDTQLIVVEQNDAFYNVLHERYGHLKNVMLVHDSATHIETILAIYGIKKVDYIVSGLPFAALPVDVSNEILKSTVRLIGAKGVFITFQYTLLKKNFMHGFFKHITITKEYRNIPPAYVFVCTNKK